MRHQPPDRRAERYRIGSGTLVSLLAGRATYRLVMLTTTVALLPVWGERRYGTYAAALAAFSWLMALVSTGPEKTVLKLLPRSPRTGPAVTAALVAVVWWLPLPVAAACLVAWAAGAAAPAVYLGVAAMQLSIGCTLLLVGLHRATGRPRADPASFLAMSVAQVGLLGAAAAGLLLPVGYAGAVVAVQTCVNLVLTARLGRPSLRIRHRPRFLWRLAVTAVLLSGTELFLYLTFAVLFTLLQVTGHGDQVGRLYVAALVVSVGVNLLLYLLRVYAPRTSLRLAGRAGVAGRTRAARLAGRVAALNLGWLVAVGVVVGVTGVAEVGSAAGQMVVWGVLLASAAPGFALLLWASYLLENTDATAPRVVAAAAVTGLLTAVAAGLATMPALGGVGLVVAMVAGHAGYAVMVAVRGRRTGVPWRGQVVTESPSAPGGTISSSTGRREPGSENVTTPSRPRA